jgi:hypothetical protein
MNNDAAINVLKEKMDEGYVLLDTKIDFDKSEEKEGMIKINIDYYFAKPEEIKVYGKENW